MIVTIDKNKTTKDSAVVVVSIAPGQDAIVPQEAALSVEGLKLSGKFVVAIEGRGPIWAYAMIAHAAHASLAVATFDPRLGGFVVVQSHSSKFTVGELIQVS